MRSHSTRPRPGPGRGPSWTVLAAAGLLLLPVLPLRADPPGKAEAPKPPTDPPAPAAREANPDDETRAALEDIRREAEQKKAERADQKKLRQKAARLNRRPSFPMGPARTIPPGRHIEIFGGMLNQQRIAPMPNPAGLVPGPMGGLAAPIPGGGWFAGPGPPRVQTFRGPGGGGFVMRW